MFSMESVCVCLGSDFEILDLENSFLVCGYIFRISRLWLSMKVMGSKSTSYKFN